MVAKGSINKRRYNRRDHMVWMKIQLVVCFHAAVTTAKVQQDVYKAIETMNGTQVGVTIQARSVIMCGIR